LSRREREQKSGFKAVTIWFTGLSGSGKSSGAKALERELFEGGQMIYRLDGDNLRFGLNRDLGFSKEHRRENIRRAAEVARLMNEAGVSVVCSFISPFAADRESAREIVGPENFVEVYFSTALAVCEERDPHGLYSKARSGEIKEFTGVTSPYEIPANPQVVVDGGQLAIEECVQKIVKFLGGSRKPEA
jgi:adenylyl-sulfate kinase